MSRLDDGGDQSASISAGKAILGLMNLPGIASGMIHRISALLDSQGSALPYLLDYDQEDLVRDGLLTEVQAARFASDEQRRWRETVIGVLSTQNVQLITYASQHYPSHLQARPKSLASPLLQVAGNPELLENPGIAFAGARNVSEAGSEISKKLAREAAERRFTIVSGGARGADSAAHQEAIDAGGQTIVVLPEGILSSLSQLRLNHIDRQNTALVSTFLPYGSWQSWRAMERNKCILGLSDRLIVIEAGDKGGTLAAGKEALQRNLPTWVLDYRQTTPSASGNQTLLHLGARPVPVAASGEATIPPGLFASDVDPDFSLQQPNLF